MSGSVENYIRLVSEAYEGSLKLPAFQRDFKWNRKQVVLLFDSIRQGYPLNGMLQIEGNREEFDGREFFGAANNAKSVPARKLILDGQQRITAGIHLFYNSPDKLNSQYFIDLNCLEIEITSAKIDIDDDLAVQNFLSELDVESGYCKARAKSADPYALLVKSHLLFTPLLLGSNAKKRAGYFEEYIARFPERKELIRNVIESHFIVSSGPTIPLISIEAEFKLDAVSRIFATLNSSGKVLTPFELVVAVLYPSKIDLKTAISDARDANKFYSNMDATGEIALQTAVIFADKNPKKSLLPKTLSASIWTTHGSDAFKWLEEAGKFLTNHLGMALDRTNSLIPYDSIFAPMASVMKEIAYPVIQGPQLASVNEKLSRWVVGTAISQRYQEGVHNKQVSDAGAVADWIKGTSEEPEWLSEVRVPGLTLATPNGARGRMLRALMNRRKLTDPVNQKECGVGSANAQLHHIFPSKFLPKLTGWDSNNDRPNLVLNTMQLDGETNRAFLHDDPSLQVAEAARHNPARYTESYAAQGIDGAALGLLQKLGKTTVDYKNFLKLRETYFESVLGEFGFKKDGSAVDSDDNEEA
ncbi:GmrSD restriction endonuclease domain-containing protein [Maricaulis salignorans]|uniref:GmrSD restriction endonuclease domain-containing protein n=1 Tax=Maricaulis salignorans TaxID=144026 RepID=UPI003A91D74E